MEAEVDHRLQLRAGELFWYVDRESEPRRAPWPAPVVADDERPVLAGHRLVECHWLTGHLPRLGHQWDRPAVHSGQNSLGELAPDSSLDQVKIVVHDARLVIAAITLAP